MIIVTTYNGLGCLENHLCDSAYFRYNSLSYGFGRHVGIKQNNLFSCKMAKSWTHDYLCGLESAQFCWSGLPTSNPPGCRAPSGTKSFGIPSQRHSWSCIAAALQGKMEEEGWNVIINCVIQILYFKTKCMPLTINRTYPTWNSEAIARAALLGNRWRMTISSKWCGCFFSLYDPYFGIFCG